MQSPGKFTNKLIGETSPYLLQHAHNPVNWYPWGEEAFEKAKAEDKPLLVSIGYSACHWCHVMEHESFEDEVTAAIMNEHFINIKVDMEERPDVDQIYMTFVQMTTGRGGWPMNVFLTPDRLPFFGGTYFPPTGRYNMPGWPQVLLSVAEAYREKRDDLLRSANEILDEMQKAVRAELSPAAVSGELSDAAFKSLERTFDAVNGGFGGAPKFPPSMTLEFLLRYWKRTGNARALEMVEKTAEKMASGGIYDQIGGGFHRYSVDSVWLVPHFEKMLYDNAQLIRIYLHLFQITKKESFRRVAADTLEYVKREMLDDSGAFYSTQDADSEGVEGKFFVWTPDEIAAVLGSDAQVFNFFYDVSEEGNFEEKNILHTPYSLEEAAGVLNIGSDELAEKLQRAREKVFLEREKRPKPFRDEKVITAWNGLMLSAFVEAGVVLENSGYTEVAKRNAEFVLNTLRENGRLLRTSKNGKAKLNGYIEDYANLADALIDLYQAVGDTKYLVTAKELADTMIEQFWDAENGGFFFTSNDHEELVLRNKDFYDNATPSGNSTAADVLIKLSKFFSDERYERFGMTVLRLVAPQIARYPNGFGRALSVVEFALGETKELVIVGPANNQLFREAAARYLPFKIMIPTTEPAADSAIVPLLAGKEALDGKPTAFVCENFACKMPTTDVEVLREQLK